MPNPLFGVREAQIAPWTATGSYGTAVDIFSINGFDFKEITVDGELRGNDQITDLASYAIGGEITMNFAFRNYQLVEVLTGVTSMSYASSGRVTKTSNEMRPYFGITILVYQSNGTGSTVLFYPKCKLTGGFQYSNKFGEYMAPNVTVKCLPDSYMGIQRIYHYEATLATLAFPPTNPS